MARRTGSPVIARHLGRLFPGTTVLPRGLVCKPSPTHFIEGALVEWTSWKGKFFVWSMMAPLWSVICPSLSYSERLDSGHIFEGPEQDIAERAAALLRKHTVFFERLRGPETSLDRFLSGELRGITPFTPKSIRPVDRGIALALNGQTAEARETLTTVVENYVPRPNNPYMDLVIAIQRSLVAGNDDYLGLIRDQEVGMARHVKITHAAAC